jgi:hypothetical protein
LHLLGAVAVPAGPAIGAGVLGLLSLLTFLAFIVCLGLKEAWYHTIGYGLRWIAAQIRGVTLDVYFWSVHPLDFLADALEAADHFIAHALAVAALNTEKAGTALWHLTAEVFWWSVHETKELAVDTWHALEHTVTVTVPDAAKWARRESVAVAHRIVHVEAAARRAADAELGHLAHVAEADAQAGIRKAEHALDWSEAKVTELDRYVHGLEARVGRLARRLSPAAIVALIGATIFNDFGLGWLRCSQVGRLGRALCGLPSHLFADLLALLADVYFVTAICELLPLIEDAYSELGTPTLHLPAVMFDGTLHLAA